MYSYWWTPEGCVRDRNYISLYSPRTQPDLMEARLRVSRKLNFLIAKGDFWGIRRVLKERSGRS